MFGGLEPARSVRNTCALVFTFLVFFSLAAQEGCTCANNGGGKDGGVPESTTKTPNPTSIRFVTPQSNEIVSGQIAIEVEVIDKDGIDEVEFHINGKLYRTLDATSRGSTKESPRYSVEVATSFLNRGVINLLVKTVDKKGERLEKAIQVKSRERWVGAFGAGQIRQLEYRSNQQIYLSIHRSEEDLARVENPGPNVRVGSAILTSHVGGVRSWDYREFDHEFGPFSLDSKGRMFLSSRNIENGSSWLVMVGPGELKWSFEVPIKPVWRVPLGEWAAKSKPFPVGDSVWIHLEKPAKASEPSVSAWVQFDTSSGKELKRYTGQAPFQVLRGPYALQSGSFAFVTRKAGKIGTGFEVLILDAQGTPAWQKTYADWRFTESYFEPKKSRLILGVEKRQEQKVTAASVWLLDCSTKKEVWKQSSGTSFSATIAANESFVFVVHNSTGTSKELISYSASDGSIVWKKTFPKHFIAGLKALPWNSLLVFTTALDDFQDPLYMQVESYGIKGQINWTYKNKNYSPQTWLMSKDGEQTLWMLVRNIEDPRKQLGTKLLTLDHNGKRIFLFAEESRSNQFLKHVKKDVLLLTSSDARDIRIHNLIAR